MSRNFLRGGIYPSRPTPHNLRGINSAGGEFGSSATQFASFGGDPVQQYGTYWHFDSQASFDYLASRGVELIRLPIGWEHVQTTLGGPLNATAFGFVTAALDRIAASGMRAIVEVHNYGTYATASSGYADQTLGQGVVTDAHLIDLWTKIATALKDHPGVMGYGLMNEPHDLYDTALTFAQRAALWRTCTNNIVQAIRNTNDDHVISVMEMAIYSVSNWATWNANKWITDPLNDREKIWYEQHIYEDANRGGKYPDSYATELSKAQAAGFSTIFARAMDWLQPWLDWLKANNVRGFIGEYGVPADTDAASWAAEAEKLITVFDQNNLHFTWWSAGEWFHQYTLAPYVQDSSNSGPVSIARPPVSTTLEKHFSRLPVASFTVGTTKPDAANSGTGVIRPEPTGIQGTLTGNQSYSTGIITGKIINGDVTLSGDAQLIDCIVHGSVKCNSVNNVVENCLIDGNTTGYTNHTWLVDCTNATQGGWAQIRFCTIQGRVASYFLNGIGKRNFYAYRCDVSAVVDCFRIEPTGVGGAGNSLVEGCFAHEMQYNSPDPTHSSNNSHDDGAQFRGGGNNVLRGNTIWGNWSATINTGNMPSSPTELSAIMLTPDVDQITATFDKNWLDYGVDTVNGGDANLTSASNLTFTGNRFGRHFTRNVFNIKATVTLTESGNVWEDTGATLHPTRP